MAILLISFFYTGYGYRAKENADYSLVVTESYSSGGKIVDTANKYGIVLMTVTCLIRWIQFHDSTPLGLDTYRLMFECPGIKYDIDGNFSQIIEARGHWTRLLRDVMDTIQEAYEHGITRSLSAMQLQPMLIMRQRGTVFYTEEEIQQALDLLAYPGIRGILDGNSMQIDLVINRQSLSKILIVVANQID